MKTLKVANHWFNDSGDVEIVLLVPLDTIHDILSWLCPSDNQDLFARARLDGYQVEEEK